MNRILLEKRMEYLSDEELIELVRGIRASFWNAINSEKVDALYLDGYPLEGQEEITEYAQNGMKPTHEAFNQEKMKKHLAKARHGENLTLLNDTMNLFSEQLIATKTQWGWVKFDDFMLAEEYR